jgi:hypothetical protein
MEHLFHQRAFIDFNSEKTTFDLKQIFHSQHLTQFSGFKLSSFLRETTLSKFIFVVGLISGMKTLGKPDLNTGYDQE